MEDTALMGQIALTNDIEKAPASVTNNADRPVTYCIEVLEDQAVTGSILRHINPVIDHTDTCVVGNHDSSVLSFDFGESGIQD